MMNKTFSELNDHMNYFSKISRTTGNDNWDLKECEREFISVFSGCDLTKEQVDSLVSFMSIDGAKKFKQQQMDRDLESKGKFFAA